MTSADTPSWPPTPLHVEVVTDDDGVGVYVRRGLRLVALGVALWTPGESRERTIRRGIRAASLNLRRGTGEVDDGG